MTVTVTPWGRQLQGGGKGGQFPCGDSRCGKYLTLIVSICLAAGFAGVVSRGLRAFDTSANPNA